MILRRYRKDDLTEILGLFYDTVHSVNAADYTEPQLDAWAGRNPNHDEWNGSLSSHYTLVALSRGADGEKIIGFGDIDGDYLDRLYVHKDYIKNGVGSELAEALEEHAAEAGFSYVTVHASVTALPFFKKRGYCMTEKNTVTRHGIEMYNFTMKKEL